jgi:hypothetical protein
MLTDHARIARQRGEPAILRLHRALTRLTGVLTYMNTGAHPDDEHNGLLAALRFAYGIRTIVACSTRGEGGQNAIGPERGAALGVLRTREMEEAARVIDAGVAWLGHGPTTRSTISASPRAARTRSCAGARRASWSASCGPTGASAPTSWRRRSSTCRASTATTAP